MRRTIATLPPHVQNKLFVPVNGVPVPFNRIAEALLPFCTPAWFHHERSACDLSKLGSALLLRYRGRNFAMCSRHQLSKDPGSKVDPEQFTITLTETDGRRVGVSPNIVSRVNMGHAEHASLEDVLLFEYEDVRGTRVLRGLFLEIGSYTTVDAVDRASLKVILSIGYPTAGSDLDPIFDDDGAMTGVDWKVGWVKLYLTLAEPALLDTENRISMIQHERQNSIDPDGMSGAPVFFVWVDSSKQAHLGFAGMITHARDRRYMVYDGAHLRDILDTYIDRSGSALNA